MRKIKLRQRRSLFIQITLLLVILILSCEREKHDTPSPEDGLARITIQLENESEQALPLGDLYFYLFNSDESLYRYRCYPDRQMLEKNQEVLKADCYTIIIVMNLDPELAIPSAEIPLSTIGLTFFLEWLDWVSEETPYLIVGVLQFTLESGSVERLTIALKDRLDRLPFLRLNVRIPTDSLPDYASSSRSLNAMKHRSVVEIYKQGSDKLIRRQVSALEQTDSMGGYVLDLPNLSAVAYDIHLWVDYAETETMNDYYYSTLNLSAVTFNAQRPYQANSPYKDALFANMQVAVNDANMERELLVEMQRPFARYRLVTLDIEAYKELIAEEGYPLLDSLTIVINYIGYFPSSFNVMRGKPNESTLGVSYLSFISDLSDSRCDIGSDYVWVNEFESSVVVEVVIIHSVSGEVITRNEGVTIHYKCGYLTTVRGHFLTGGRGTKEGIGIDTSWENEYNVTLN